MRQSGSSIVEVVVMMVIISVSIVGVYSMINNAQKLAKTTDDRLIATNLAKEWLESVGALRDTFKLRAHEGTNNCFFTIDLSNLNNDKCYYTSETGTKYFLLDNKTLAVNTDNKPAPVCINTAGWYSQEFSTPSISCSTWLTFCWEGTQKWCKTKFTRDIVFERCAEPANECIKARINITWWKSGEDSLSLEQIFTKN